MKKPFRFSLVLLSAAGLAACETIDEERFANVACDDLKQLVAAQNLTELSRSESTFGLDQYDRQKREDRNLFDIDKTTKRDVELRAAYRKNCR